MALNIVESNTVENNLYLSCVRAGGSPLLQLEVSGINRPLGTSLAPRQFKFNPHRWLFNQYLYMGLTDFPI